MPLLVDSHEDLAWNILTFGRDYTRSVAETRRLEHGSTAEKENGATLLGWPEYQRGQVAIVFSTLFASPRRRLVGDWETIAYDDDDYEQAHQLYLRQLYTYRDLTDAHPDKFRLIRTQKELQVHLAEWQRPADEKDGHPVGLVVLMEGAEGVRNVKELNQWWELGLRIIGPAWTGTRYCGGTREPGPLTTDGRQLLSAMAEFNYTLDLSHMDEQAALQALDFYPGPIIASHANALALLPGSESNRHLSDRLITGLIEREAVIGVVPYCMFLKTGWKIGDPREGITLEQVAAHIDHICQLGGDAHHAAIGTDFDGGFGLNAAPSDVDSIADLQKLSKLLENRGYTKDDIVAVFGQNWLRHLNQQLPQS